MKNSIYLLLILTGLFGCKGCDDAQNPEPTLPPVTTTGANTFGCNVNGKLWLPNKKKNSDLPNIEGGIKARWKTDGKYDVNFYDFLLFANNGKGEGFQIYLNRLSSAGTSPLIYPFNIWPGCSQCDVSYGYYYTKDKRYSSLEVVESRVNLTRYDTLNLIFSGNFSFTAKNRSGNDTVRITDGRFDIDMIKIN